MGVDTEKNSIPYYDSDESFMSMEIIEAFLRSKNFGGAEVISKRTKDPNFTMRLIEKHRAQYKSKCSEPDPKDLVTVIERKVVMVSHLLSPDNQASE